MHPRGLRCSSLKYSGYCTPPCTRRTVGAPLCGRRAAPPGSPRRGLCAVGWAIGAPRRPRCNAGLSPRTVNAWRAGRSWVVSMRTRTADAGVRQWIVDDVGLRHASPRESALVRAGDPERPQGSGKLKLRTDYMPESQREFDDAELSWEFRPTLGAAHAFPHRQHVPTRVPAVIHLVGNRSRDVDAEPADWPFFNRKIEIRPRYVQRIEWPAVVLDADRQDAILQRQGHQNLMFALVVVAVRDDVDHDLVEQQVDAVDVVGGETMCLAELLNQPGEALDLTPVIEEGDRDNLRHAHSRQPETREPSRLNAEAAKGAKKDSICLRPSRPLRSSLVSVMGPTCSMCPPGHRRAHTFRHTAAEAFPRPTRPAVRRAGRLRTGSADRWLGAAASPHRENRGSLLRGASSPADHRGGTPAASSA